MRSKVHRHLVGQIRELASELKSLPNHVILSQEYKDTRQMMLEQISLAMKCSMRADVFTGRAENPTIYRSTTHASREFDVKVCRENAADSWWGWRKAIRRARMYHSFARIYLEFDQDHIQNGRDS